MNCCRARCNKPHGIKANCVHFDGSRSTEMLSDVMCIGSLSANTHTQTSAHSGFVRISNTHRHKDRGGGGNKYRMISNSKGRVLSVYAWASVCRTCLRSVPLHSTPFYSTIHSTLWRWRRRCSLFVFAQWEQRACEADVCERVWDECLLDERCECEMWVYAAWKGNSTKQVSGQCLYTLIHAHTCMAYTPYHAVCCLLLKSTNFQMRYTKTSNACERNQRLEYWQCVGFAHMTFLLSTCSCHGIQCFRTQLETKTIPK